MKSFSHFQSNFAKYFGKKLENDTMDEARGTKELNMNAYKTGVCVKAQ